MSIKELFVQGHKALNDKEASIRLSKVETLVRGMLKSCLFEETKDDLYRQIALTLDAFLANPVANLPFLEQYFNYENILKFSDFSVSRTAAERVMRGNEPVWDLIKVFKHHYTLNPMTPKQHNFAISGFFRIEQFYQENQDVEQEFGVNSLLECCGFRAFWLCAQTNLDTLSLSEGIYNQ